MIKELKAMIRRLVLLNTAYLLIIPMFGFILFKNMEILRRLPTVIYLGFAIIIFFLSRSVFKSKTKTIYKAIYFTVPLTVIYTTIRMFFYSKPIFFYLLNTYFFFGFLYYFRRQKLSWLYYYALILVSFVMLIFSIK